MTIYVSNLNFRLQNKELSELFATYGNVEAVKIITDRITGQSKGFAFVEMVDNNAGNEAIAKLNGHIVGGRTLVVNMAHTREKTIASTIVDHAS